MTACSPDRQLVFPQKSVTLEVWAAPSEGEVLKYLWQVDAGTTIGGGAKVRWDFTGLSPGSYKATVQVIGQKSTFSECRLSVTVGLPPLTLMGGGYETGGSILLPEQEEDKNYGLYSYLLLGSEPDDMNHERYIQVIIEYLKFPDVKNLQQNGFKREELNITYLPLETEFDQSLLRELTARNYGKYPEVAEWILKHYDYPRARALLRTLPDNHRTGPYIISFLKPLGKNPLTPPYLYINISTVPLDLVNIWMKYFQDQASQEQYWDEKAVNLLVLKLRTSIGVAADGLTDGEKALVDWVAWIDKVS